MQTSDRQLREARDFYGDIGAADRLRASKKNSRCELLSLRL